MRCSTCKGKNSISIPGRCTSCMGSTGYAIEQLCKQCSAKHGECQVCRVKLPSGKTK